MRLFLYRTPTEGTFLRSDSGYQPGVISIIDNKIRVIITDYDDNGTFIFTESKRINNEVVLVHIMNQGILQSD